MMWYSRVFIMLQLFLVGCSDKVVGEREEVAAAIKKLAPDDGDGIISYRYKSGELMQEIRWSDFEMISLTWYNKAGKVLLNSVPSNNRFLALEIDESGAIKSVFECEALVKDGVSFEFQDNCLKSVQTWNFGEIVSTVDIDVETDGK